jgi:hypothetical protein
MIAVDWKALSPFASALWALGIGLRSNAAARQRRLRAKVNVVAAYVFYRTGEPLAALASSRTLPIDAEQLEALLSVVGNFVETSTSSLKSYASTAMVYDNLGIIAVRGRQIIAAVVYEGPVYGALRKELRKTVQEFEERRASELASFDSASRVAEEAADELSKLLRGSTEKEIPPKRPRAPLRGSRQSREPGSR